VARSEFTDFLQNHHFWLVEISVSSRAPYFVAGSLTSGFQSVTMPEITGETESVSQMCSPYRVNYNRTYTYNSLTLLRGVTSYDSSFYRWMYRSMRGEDRVQRNFLLLHFSNVGVDQGGAPLKTGIAQNVGLGNLETLRAFGKGYYLWDCIPVRYKAGSDLDASSGDVSIAELDIQPSYFTEFSLDPLQLTDLNAVPALGIAI
jgi:phage tail-like protein